MTEKFDDMIADLWIDLQMLIVIGDAFDFSRTVDAYLVERVVTNETRHGIPSPFSVKDYTKFSH
jgi:hypothetical protein